MEGGWEGGREGGREGREGGTYLEGWFFCPVSDGDVGLDDEGVLGEGGREGGREGGKKGENK